jgi:pilus assembly protein Flp/PilA
MSNFSQSFKAFLADERGATAIEYGLLASLIAVAIIAGASAVGDKLGEIFDYVDGKLVVPAA